jgi:non-ribosomal peptide synthase protein (TIGR01720 family)
LSQGQAITLPAKTSSYQQWALKLVDYAKSAALESELNYWLTASEEKISNLPVDFAGGWNTVASSAKVTIALNESETQALLHELPSAYRSQINEVLLTALAQTLANWTGENSLLFDLEGHGREPLFADVDLSRTVGWFTSVFPVNLNWGETDDLIAILKAVKEQLRRIPQQGIGYGLLRYLGRKEIAQQLAELPAAQISFNYLGQFDQMFDDTPMLTPSYEAIGAVQSPQAIRAYLLEVDCLVQNNQLHINWTYSTALHQQRTVENLAQGFVAALRSLINRCQSPDSSSYTPSDFVAANISATDFGKLFAQINQAGGR